MAVMDVDENGIPIIADPVSASGRKRKAIFDAASAEFMHEGYAAASMDEIARRAGVSKPTIYNHFGNKERLFLAVVGGALSQVYSGVDPRSTRLTQAPDLRAALVDFMVSWARRVLREDFASLRRLVIAEVGRFPQLGRFWYRITNEMMDSHLVEAFAELHDRGVLDIPDTQRAMRQLIGLTLSPPQLLQTFMPDYDVVDAELEKSITDGVDVFLNHYMRIGER
ncbi:TetR/AcrR family transcriptional regulator [Kibdelosporangium phytohabitans]|uniref:TetR family transcriptional regulator n=1 Tax=Kibdelosporangium phytohabitans TaxID=860235 RepID=A0A0N9HRB0_9PSEU|nr:TetR/AcrR family transcriptional regulator [Kibdelosporangium phytohabitans]ALG09731.1 TetR family transcriptional regulator [Kibdelosporangium phytohabitans]MBE1468904.1 AcrR family transcriptional regulator [Kibdelosporangium phytohabitans]